MTDAREVIAELKQRVYSRQGVAVEAKVGTALADDIIAALSAAGLEIVNAQVRPDWKQIARDMIGLHDLMRRRGYFEAAESLEAATDE